MVAVLFNWVLTDILASSHFDMLTNTIFSWQKKMRNHLILWKVSYLRHQFEWKYYCFILILTQSQKNFMLNHEHVNNRQFPATLAGARPMQAISFLFLSLPQPMSFSSSRSKKVFVKFFIEPCYEAIIRSYSYNIYRNNFSPPG